MKTLIPRRLEARDLLIGRLAAFRPGLNIVHHGQSWRFELVDAAALQRDDTVIALDFPEFEVLLRVSGTSMAAMAAASCSVAPSTLPPALQAAVVVAAAEEIAHSRGLGIRTLPATVPSGDLCALGWVAYLDGCLIARGAVEAFPSVWSELLDSHAWQQPADETGTVLPELPLPLHLELGRLILPLNEAQALRAGDVLLPDQTIDPGHVELVIAGCLHARAVLTGQTVRLETRLRRRPMDTQQHLPKYLDDGEATPGEADSQSGFDPVAGVEPPDLIDDIPVMLSFQLGEANLPLSAVRALRENAVIELHQPLRRYVSIRSNGLHLADGELVEIEGRLGVQIVAMAQRRS
ncbi:MAG: type III secretion system cytoplasmic ring protein SctQ [Burkholderiaceae bacterium]|nr:type III secretion system cytoplasmic ring protein SctQ [Burkholderiaceae bacterium]